MNGPAGSPRQTTAWDTFVLAMCARLAHFPQVHLAPKFPPDRLNLVMRTQLPLQEKELLVALIDSDAGGFQSEIILTTAQLYWLQRDPDANGSRLTRNPATIRAYGADYASIPQETSIVPSAEGSLDIVLGARLAVPIHGGGRELAEAVAGYLRTVGEQARKGMEPTLAGFDPKLVERIALALPRVAEVTQRTCLLNRDLNLFRRDLRAATRHVVITPVLVAACVAVFVLMVLRGVNPFLPTTRQLLEWGANDGARVVLRHEIWRLPASVFIHGGVLHLAINMWCLLNIGPLVERFFGNTATALLYLAAGVGGAIASMATLPVRVSVGASGAIFGLLGALLAFLLINHRTVPTTVLRPLRSSALSFVVFNTLFGAAVPMIDQSAHLGGLVAGFLGGLMVIRPWPVVRSPWMSLRRLTMGLALVGAVLGAGIAAVRWREQTLPPIARIDDFNNQAAPAVIEFNAVLQALPRASELADQARSEVSSKELSGSLHDLQARAAANRQRMSRIVTPDPDLQSIRQTLIDGQDAQIATLAAAIKYLETRKTDWLTGPTGVFAGEAAVLRATQDLKRRQQTLLESHGLVTGGDDPRP